MAKKDLKINIKNTQIAQALQLDKLKEKLATKKADLGPAKKTEAKKSVKKPGKPTAEEVISSEKEEPPRRKARSRSVFAEPMAGTEIEEAEILLHEEEPVTGSILESDETSEAEQISTFEEPAFKESEEVAIEQVPVPEIKVEAPPPIVEAPKLPKREVLGPTGRHINDLIPRKVVVDKIPDTKDSQALKDKEKPKKPKAKEREPSTPLPPKDEKVARFKEFKDLKPARKQDPKRFGARGRQGLVEGEDELRYRKRKTKGYREEIEDLTIRPKELSVRVPITVKELASVMKLKASQLIQKLFLQGIIVTINDQLEDETTIQLLGEEFECKIIIDTTEEERIRITGKTIKEEIDETDPEKLTLRAPVVTFMGHVDHGKTSLIDYIRKANVAGGEAGAITQHIGAFLCSTAIGDIAVLDTPGHEAFSEMRARGADVTDIVVLVVAGDEGLRAQTIEAINHAKAAKVTIVVAINKSDKPNFDIENVYRQLAEQELLPETWGGQTITVKCSAVTGEGIKELLEMLALQAEVLELKANPDSRARGTVLESELHKGLGASTTVLVQNGTLRIGDSLVFEEHYGKVKTMKDEFGNDLKEAPPSTPIEITGLSGLPSAGQEFIVVSSDKEARVISEARTIGKRQLYLTKTKKASLESIFQQAADAPKKTLRMVLRADVQGSLEALRIALLKIKSEKVELEIISTGVGEISESDVLLAAASKAMIIGFHTQVEAHADQLVKQHAIHVSIHDIIYHAIDEVRALMTGLLDKIPEEREQGKAEVRAVFKASQLGKIAGCYVTEGTIHRSDKVRLVRKGEVIWKGSMGSLKRVKEDVREVTKGLECGILLSGTDAIEEGDIIEAFEIIYLSQEL